MTHPTSTSTSAVEALRELLIAVKYKTPPVNFGTDEDPNPCYEARVPVAFVTKAEAALDQGDGHASDCADPSDNDERLECARGALQVIASGKAGADAPQIAQAGLDLLEHGVDGCAVMRGDKPESPTPAPGASWTEEQLGVGENGMGFLRVDEFGNGIGSLSAPTPPVAQGHGAVGAGWRPIESADQINDRLKRQREGGLSTLADWLHREAARSMGSSYGGSWCPSTLQFEAWRRSVMEAQSVIRRTLTAPDAAPAQPEAAEMPGREDLARIIDPESWGYIDRFGHELGAAYPGAKAEPSLIKADAILALLSPSAKES